MIRKNGTSFFLHIMSNHHRHHPPQNYWKAWTRLLLLLHKASSASYIFLSALSSNWLIFFPEGSLLVYIENGKGVMSIFELMTSFFNGTIKKLPYEKKMCWITDTSLSWKWCMTRSYAVWFGGDYVRNSTTHNVKRSKKSS